METPKKRLPGRPSGRAYTHTKSVKLRDEDKRRLERLAKKLDRDESSVIRVAVERLAQAEGLE